MNEFLPALLRAFWVGGALCVAGQLLLDLANLTPAISLSILVCAGSATGVFGWYDMLAEYAGCGATLPIVSFGNTLTAGAVEGAGQSGFIGLFTGLLGPVSTGIATAICTGFLVALLFRPKA